MENGKAMAQSLLGYHTNLVGGGIIWKEMPPTYNLSILEQKYDLVNSNIIRWLLLLHRPPVWLFYNILIKDRAAQRPFYEDAS